MLTAGKLSRSLLLCKFSPAPLENCLRCFFSLTLTLRLSSSLPHFDNYYWISFVLHLLLVFILPRLVAIVFSPPTDSSAAFDQHVNKLIRLTSHFYLTLPTWFSRWGCLTRQLPDPDPVAVPDPIPEPDV